jgi:hypothetical protein
MLVRLTLSETLIEALLMYFYTDRKCISFHQDDACKDFNGVYFYVGEGSCGSNNACKSSSGNTLIYSRSCSGVSSCAFASGDTMIQESSCNALNCCNRMDGNTLIYSESCSGPVSFSCIGMLSHLELLPSYHIKFTSFGLDGLLEYSG